ncbi:hypothetical protein F511_23544 [Dorcoceras hygrometricum]|uniref:Uncharacterized protein n=1 Tax=Dorcoceras hygrometricum TaxID=472368 RepID=A0A2Z7BLZ9_9LAMI|nr:hypothetical protein F511_23544 [Dorcoceras hygrometricum]
MSTLKAVKSAQFVPSSLKYLNRVLKSRCNLRPNQPDLPWLGKTRQRLPGTESVPEHYSTLKQGLNWQGITYPKTHNNQRTIDQISPEILVHQQLHANFLKSFYSLKRVAIERQTLKESSATKIAQNNCNDQII